MALYNDLFMESFGISVVEMQKEMEDTEKLVNKATKLIENNQSFDVIEKETGLPKWFIERLTSIHKQDILICENINKIKELKEQLKQEENKRVRFNVLLAQKEKEQVILQALQTKSLTSLERLFVQLCEKHSLPFKFVGNGAVIIDRKKPDFIHTDGQKLIIETANSYHHKKGIYEVQRTEIFAKHNFKTLVLWDTDFYEKQTKLYVDWEQRVLGLVKPFTGS